MEFQLTEDFVKDNGFTEEQVKAVTGLVTESYIPELQKSWDGKANENAEGIIAGAIKSAQKTFSVDLPREQGEKYADYLNRLSSHVIGEKQSQVDTKLKELDLKMKDFKGNETLSKEYETLKQEKESLLKKYADYEEQVEKASKYDEAQQTLSTLKLEVAFNGVKPNFPKEVNVYEAKAKWDEFKSNVQDKNIIEIIDGEAWAIDKENHYKKTKLSELVAQDENISELMKGRQQTGIGGQPVDFEAIEGVPFKVPANADGKTRSKLIKEYLATKNITSTHPSFSKEFKELNDKILQGKNQAA